MKEKPSYHTEFPPNFLGKMLLTVEKGVIPTTKEEESIVTTDFSFRFAAFEMTLWLKIIIGKKKFLTKGSDCICFCNPPKKYYPLAASMKKRNMKMKEY